MFDEIKNLLGKEFEAEFNEKATDFFLSPGRLEIVGNHTDHNNGLALVASASIYAKAAVKKNNLNKIILISKGFGKTVVDVEYSEPNNSEFSTTKSLINGIIAGFLKRNYSVGGLNIYVESDVTSGSGISSSAAFELLISTIFNDIFNENKIDKLDLVHISQDAENKYFGKPSGLLDQIGCAYGGLCYVDFKDTKNPVIKNVQFPFDRKIILTNPGGSHAGLDSYYASIPVDMKNVAEVFNETNLRAVGKDRFFEKTTQNPDIFTKMQANRALHFFKECERVETAYKAILDKNCDLFLEQINESGLSSSNVLCNTQVEGRFENSPERALQIARECCPEDAHRVHGGGFMGTIISFVKESNVKDLKGEMIKAFGENSVVETDISPFGSTKI